MNSKELHNKRDALSVISGIADNFPGKISRNTPGDSLSVTSNERCITTEILGKAASCRGDGATVGGYVPEGDLPLTAVRDQAAARLTSGGAEGRSEPASTPRPCGLPRCRVCRALWFITGPQASLGARRHHPPTTPAACATAKRIHASMLQYQLEYGEPCPKLEVVAHAAGLKSAGLVSLYLYKLAAEGQTRRVHVNGPGRRYRWEAIA